MGEPLKLDELETFRKLTQRERPPTECVDELWAVVGRRGGRTNAMSTLAVNLGGLVDHKTCCPLVSVACSLIVPDMKPAKGALDYATGILESTPFLSPLTSTIDTVPRSPLAKTDQLIGDCLAEQQRRRPRFSHPLTQEFHVAEVFFLGEGTN
jgi:hypothetical protein